MDRLGRSLRGHCDASRDTSSVLTQPHVSRCTSLIAIAGKLAHVTLEACADWNLTGFELKVCFRSAIPLPPSRARTRIQKACSSARVTITSVRTNSRVCIIADRCCG